MSKLLAVQAGARERIRAADDMLGLERQRTQRRREERQQEQFLLQEAQRRDRARREAESAREAEDARADFERRKRALEERYVWEGPLGRARVKADPDPSGRPRGELSPTRPTSTFRTADADVGSGLVTTLDPPRPSPAPARGAKTTVAKTTVARLDAALKLWEDALRGAFSRVDEEVPASVRGAGAAAERGGASDRRGSFDSYAWDPGGPRLLFAAGV